MEKETDIENSVSFSVLMTAKDIFRFSIHHSYCKLSGIIGLILSLGAFVTLFTSFSSLGDSNKAVLLVVGLWFTVFEPVTLWSRSRSQAKRNPAYKMPLCYTINEEGITVSQEEQSQSISWDRIVKVVKTSKQYLVYSSKIHAFVFPKESMGNQCEAFEDIVMEYGKKSGAKVSGKIKKHNM